MPASGRVVLVLALDLELAITLGVRGTSGEADHHLELVVAVGGADMVGHDRVAP